MDAKKAAAATAIAAWWRARPRATNSGPDPHPPLREEVVAGRDELGHFAFTVGEVRTVDTQRGSPANAGEGSDELRAQDERNRREPEIRLSGIPNAGGVGSGRDPGRTGGFWTQGCQCAPGFPGVSDPIVCVQCRSVNPVPLGRFG